MDCRGQAQQWRWPAPLAPQDDKISCHRGVDQCHRLRYIRPEPRPIGRGPAGI